MNVLIIYATFSGSTLTAAQLIEAVLKRKGHAVTLKSANEADPSEMNNYDLVVLGSCTWDFSGLEGQLHSYFVDFAKKLQGKDFSQKKFAVFGLGDKTYTHFCAAVDHLEKIVADVKGQKIKDSLRIDRFYFNQEAETKRLQSWAEKLVSE